MNNDTPADAITQADRDAADALFSTMDYPRAAPEHVVQAFARHRTTSLAAQDMEPVADEVADCISRGAALVALERVTHNTADDLPDGCTAQYALLVAMNRSYQAINLLPFKGSSLTEALREANRLAETLTEYDGEVCNIAESILTALQPALASIEVKS